MSKMNINQVVVGNFYNTEEYFSLNPSKKRGVMRYFFTGDNCSCCLNMIPPKWPSVPEHSHVHEQFLLVPQGDGKITVEGVEYDAEPGSFVYCPSGISHGYDASEATYTSWNLDIFFPERLEYEKDNYFRLLAQGKDPMETQITKDTIEE